MRETVTTVPPHCFVLLNSKIIYQSGQWCIVVALIQYVTSYLHSLTDLKAVLVFKLDRHHNVATSSGIQICHCVRICSTFHPVTLCNYCVRVIDSTHTSFSLCALLI